MPHEIIKIVVIGLFVLAIVYHFSKSPQYEMLMATLIIAAIAFVIKRKETYSMEGV